MPRYAPYGFTRTPFNFYIPLPTGTGAVEPITDIVPGFNFIVEKVTMVTAVAYTGASASRTFRILKGASTVAATRTLVLADGATVGQKVEFTVSTTVADTVFGDADTLSVDFVAGGTAFTAGAGNLIITVRELAQRDR